MPTFTVLLHVKKINKKDNWSKIGANSISLVYRQKYAPVDVSLIMCSWNVRFGAVGGDGGLESSVILILKHNTQKQEANTTFLDHIQIQ